MNKRWSAFAQLTKIDEEKRLIYGRLAQEYPDKSNEIMDYESSKQNFEKWIDSTKELSKGKAEGNLRAMHGNVAAGIFTQIAFNDSENAIDAIAHVVDDNEWEKCLKGVYTGFSIGGSYGNKWNDGIYTRYTAVPVEGSLVDRPCIPTATFFEVQKADGTLEKREWPVEKIAERSDVKPEAGESKYGDVKFADEKNKKYPIDTEAHIRAAWNYINKPKNAGFYSSSDLKTIKGKIIAAWKTKIDKEGPPSASEKSEAIATLKKYYGNVVDFIPQHEDVANMGEINDLETAMSCLDMIYRLFIREKGSEDHPEAPKQIAALKVVIEGLKTFIASEVTEIKTVEEKEAEKMEKAGRVISSTNLQKIQAIHDHTTEMGAKCNKTEDNESNKKEKGEFEAMNKLEDVKKRIKDMLAELEDMDDMEDCAKGLRDALKMEDEKEMEEAAKKYRKMIDAKKSAKKDEEIDRMKKVISELSERLSKLEAQPVNKGYTGRTGDVDQNFLKSEKGSDITKMYKDIWSKPNYGDPRMEK